MITFVEAYTVIRVPATCLPLQSDVTRLTEYSTRLNCEVYGDRVPCGDLFEHRATEAVTALGHVKLLARRPRYGISVVPRIHCARSGADEGVQALEHTHYLRL